MSLSIIQFLYLNANLTIVLVGQATQTLHNLTLQSIINSSVVPHLTVRLCQGPSGKVPTKGTLMLKSVRKFVQ